MQKSNLRVKKYILEHKKLRKDSTVSGLKYPYFKLLLNYFLITNKNLFLKFSYFVKKITLQKKGYTALFYSVLFGHRETCLELLNAGSDVNKYGNNGCQVSKRRDKKFDFEN